MGRYVYLLASAEAKHFNIPEHPLLDDARIQTVAVCLSGWENPVYNYLGLGDGDHDMDGNYLSESIEDMKWAIENDQADQESTEAYNDFIACVQPYLDSQDQYDWSYRVEDSY